MPWNKCEGIFRGPTLLVFSLTEFPSELSGSSRHLCLFLPVGVNILKIEVSRLCISKRQSSCNECGKAHITLIEQLNCEDNRGKTFYDFIVPAPKNRSIILTETSISICPRFRTTKRRVFLGWVLWEEATLTTMSDHGNSLSAIIANWSLLIK